VPTFSFLLVAWKNFFEGRWRMLQKWRNLMKNCDFCGKKWPGMRGNVCGKG